MNIFTQVLNVTQIHEWDADILLGMKRICTVEAVSKGDGRCAVITIHIQMS